MDLRFVLFIFLAIILVTGGSYSYYSAGQEVTAGLFFLGSIGAMIFFGLRWFSGMEVAAGATTITTWPPKINFCPDFLTLYTKSDGTKVCIDTIGVAGTGGLAKVAASTTPGDSNFFNLFIGQSGQQRIDSLCNEAKTKKVTWEGVWDGTVCYGKEPPKP